jgi:RHS repeat-associated protein
MGQRIAKIVKDRTGATPADRNEWRITWYVRDASGNFHSSYLLRQRKIRDVNPVRNETGVMSTYEEETEENSEAECPAGTYDYTTTIAWSEAHIYGSSRVGMEIQSAVTSRFGVNYDSNDLPTYTAGNCISYAATAVYSQKYGDKRFELSNHLGNVLVVVSDRLIANTGTTLSYSSEVISATDYYPYGMVMYERNYLQIVSEAYRYAFNGKELDKPGMGGGQSTYDYGFRIYNPAIAKFLSVDPLTREYPWYTPYQFAGNKSIWCSDLDGKEEEIKTVVWGYWPDDPGVKEKIILVKWSDLYPGQEHGPRGNGVLKVYVKRDQPNIPIFNPEYEETMAETMENVVENTVDGFIGIIDWFDNVGISIESEDGQSKNQNSQAKSAFTVSFEFLDVLGAQVKKVLGPYPTTTNNYNSQTDKQQKKQEPELPTDQVKPIEKEQKVDESKDTTVGVWKQWHNPETGEDWGRTGGVYILSKDSLKNLEKQRKDLIIEKPDKK